MPIQQAATALMGPDAGFAWVGGLYWPRELGIDIAHIPEGGLRVPADFEKHRDIFLALRQSFGLGNAFIDDGYLYSGVRICRVDPQAPQTVCTNPDDKTP